jgi:3-deoxy-7-phosphoheptulonate synthase
LKGLSEKVQDTLVLIMRVYFEKPRTNTGWQGLINDPGLDGTFNVETGLQLARRLLLDIAEIGLPAAGEALDLVTPQYIQDLFSWTAIGARTAESQTHRKMASGLTTAVGFKNGTDGNLASAVNAMISAAEPSHFISISPDGRSSVIRTLGNPNTHVVLRGGAKGPNYDEESIGKCESMMRLAGVPVNIMVDCSHANSGKRAAKQPEVLHEVTRQILAGNRSIAGLMLESNIHWGKQNIPDDPALLKYGISVTDECIDWQTTEEIILNLADRLRNHLPRRSR